jgi:hypothetical protein
MTAIKTTAAIPKKYMMVSLMVMVTVLSLRGALDAFKTERPVSHYPAVGWASLRLLSASWTDRASFINFVAVSSGIGPLFKAAAYP